MTPITIASPNPVPARFACGAYQYDRIVVYSPSGGPSETKSERIADAPGPENDLGVFRHRIQSVRGRVEELGGTLDHEAGSFDAVTPMRSFANLSACLEAYATRARRLRRVRRTTVG